MINHEVIDVLRAHSSVRSFTDEPVSQDVIDTILACAQRAPTSSNLQAYSIIQVESMEKRTALMEYSGGQSWLVKAPLVLLFCADLYRCHKLLAPADKHVLHNAELFSVAVSDAALVAQKAFIAAQACGLGGVVVGGVRNETDKMAELFDLPKLVFPMYALCLGYPAKVPVQRPRFPMHFVHAVDRYPGLPQEEELCDYDDATRKYFLEHTNDPNEFGWIARGQFAITSKPRYEVGDFLKKAGFLTETKPFTEDEKA